MGDPVIRESAWLGSFHRERGMPGPTHAQNPHVLRLSAAGMSKRQIAIGLGVSATAAGIAFCVRSAPASPGRYRTA